MANIRCQVITRGEADLAIDHIVNVVYFNDFNLVDPTDYDNIASSLRDAFRARSFQPAGFGVEVKVYDMANPLPRPIKGEAPWQASIGAAAASVPREVALCLSFFATRNLPRQRGRLYIGPWNTGIVGPRPSDSQRQTLVDLAVAIAAVGGVDVDWSVHSVVDNNFQDVTEGWVDNEWDTIRSRGLRATGRQVFTVNE